MIIPALETLYKAFDAINTKYFESKLAQPIITIQTNSHYNKNCLGWCTVDPLWKSKEDKKFKQWEICVCSERLKDDMISIVETLMHEVVHYANASYGIEDCKRGKHNEHFKELAERVGLKVSKRRGVGWGMTEPTEDFVNFVVSLKLDMKVFDCFRDIIEKEKTKRKKKMFKFQCPECKEIIKGKATLKAVCEDCGQEFILIEEVEESED